MARKYKDSPKRSAGRPSNSEMTERQALIKRELITTLKPYYKPAAEQLAVLAGIVVRPKADLKIEEEEDLPKAETISNSIKYNACKALMDKFEEALDKLYDKADGTPAKTPVVEEPPKLASVSKLSLTLTTPKED